MLDTGIREEVAYLDMQLGDRADVEPLDIQDPAPDVGVVWLFAVMEQLDFGPGLIGSWQPAPVIRQIATSIESALVPEIRPDHVPGLLSRQALEMPADRVHRRDSRHPGLADPMSRRIVAFATVEPLFVQQWLNGYTGGSHRADS